MTFPCCVFCFVIRIVSCVPRLFKLCFEVEDAGVLLRKPRGIGHHLKNSQWTMIEHTFLIYLIGDEINTCADNLTIDFDYYTTVNQLSFSPASLLDMFWIFANNEIYSCLHLFQFEILLLQGLLTVGPVTTEMDVYPDTKIQLHVRGGSILPMQEPARNTVHRYTGFLLYHFIYYMTLSGYFKMKFPVCIFQTDLTKLLQSLR